MDTAGIDVDEPRGLSLGQVSGPSATTTPSERASPAYPGSTATARNRSNLNTVTSRTPSTAIALSTGANTITVRVTAESGATKDYTVTITRQSPPPQQDPPGLPPIAARYDTNNDGAIDGTEYQQVKNDWLTAKITYAQFLEVVKIHLKSN